MRIVVILLFFGSICYPNNTNWGIKYIPRDFIYIFTSPATASFSDILLYSTAGAITIGLIAIVDEPVRKVVQQNRVEHVDTALSYIQKFGDGYLMLPVLTTGYIFGLVINDKKVQKTSFLAIESFIFTGLIVTIAKPIFGRARPYENTGHWFFKPLSFENRYWSLPSGHTGVAFSTASVIAHSYNNFWLSLFLYSLATLTALARVNFDQHWTSDIFLGAIIGISVGRAIVLINNKESETNSVNATQNCLTVTVFKMNF